MPACKPLHFSKGRRAEDHLCPHNGELSAYPPCENADFSDFAVGIRGMPPDLKRCFYQS